MPGSLNGMKQDSFQLLRELMAAQKAGTPVVLATVVKARGSVPRHAGSKMLVYADGRISGTIGGGEMESRVIQAALEALQDDAPRTIPYALVDPRKGDPGVCGGEMEVYVEPYTPPATLFIIGCGHVGQAVADLGHWLGFRVVVTDDREELATPQIIPHADMHLPGGIADALAQFTVNRYTAVVVVTRNVMVDREALPLLLQTPAAYIGVMGSKRRWAHTVDLLRQDGVPQEAIDRIHSPLGLELNAETPKEIAVSILAEIIMQRRGGDGRPMSA